MMKYEILCTFSAETDQDAEIIACALKRETNLQFGKDRMQLALYSGAVGNICIDENVPPDRG